MGEMAENNYIKFQDFDIKKLRLRDSVINEKFNYQTMKIEYEYNDGEIRVLRLRSPPLFSRRVHQSMSKSSDYFMSLKSFYDEENPNEKETEFKKMIDSISEFLRKEALGKVIKKKKNNNDFKDLEIIKENIFYPKLNQDKAYDKNGKLKKCIIRTNFYEKNKEGNLEKVKDPNSLEKISCKVVAYIDIADIFINSSMIKVRTYLSDVAIIKRVANDSFTPSKVTLGSDDESSDENDDENDEE